MVGVPDVVRVPRAMVLPVPALTLFTSMVVAPVPVTTTGLAVAAPLKVMTPLLAAPLLLRKRAVGSPVVGVVSVTVPVPRPPGAAVGAPFTCKLPLEIVTPPVKLLAGLERRTRPAWVVALA